MSGGSLRLIIKEPENGGLSPTFSFARRRDFSEIDTAAYIKAHLLFRRRIF